MNRILLENSDRLEDGTFEIDDERARHVLTVLDAQPGQLLRVGLLNGPLGEAEVVTIAGHKIKLQPAWQETPARSRISLLLALPRPKVMRRLWAQLSAMGVDQIILTNAAKVERHYFDTHWLEPATYNARLAEGLQQCGDTLLPEVSIIRRLKPFIEDELQRQFGDHKKLLTHPRAQQTFRDIKLAPESRLLLAVGPEGGWTDFELELLQASGFATVSMGSRTLRSDTACVALLALAGNLMDTTHENKPA